MNHKKKKYIVFFLVCLSLTATFIWILFNKEKPREPIPIKISSDNISRTIQYGVNSAYLKEGSPSYESLSLAITAQHLEESLHIEFAKEVKEVQVILNPNLYDFEVFQEELKEVITQISQEHQVYITIDDIQERTTREALDLYQLTQQLFAGTEVIIAYDYNFYEDFEHVEYISMRISNQDDLKKMRKLQEELTKNNQQHIQVIINDFIAVENEDLKTILDLIYQLYYDVALYMTNVTWIHQQSNLGVEDIKVWETYEQILENPWLVREDKTNGTGVLYQPLDASKMYTLDDEIEIVVPEQENIEYVQYKVNDVLIPATSRYPYRYRIEEDTLDYTYNRLAIIIKLKDTEELYIQNLYILKEGVAGYSERNARQTPIYDQNEQMIYERNYIPVLMYHEFMDVVGESKEEQSITVGTALFEAQISKLVEEGYTGITFLDLQNYLDGVGGLPEKPIIITTDDGYMSNYQVAYPILQKYNMPATYLITSHYVGVMTTRDHFTWEQAKEMEQSGLIDIQSHTHTHPQLNLLTEAEVQYEIGRSFELIESNLGKRDVYAMSYPQFLHNDNTIEWISEMGIDFQMTNLNKSDSETTNLDVKRIHVSNETTPEKLIAEIERLTMK